MPHPKKKKNSTHRSPSRSKRRKAGGSFISGLLQRIPMWWGIVGIVAMILLYCFLLYRFFVEPYSFQWKAIYGETSYPPSYTIRGIDISHYQDRINWERLCKTNMGTDPVTFVIVKATEGVSLKDRCFDDNFKQAHASGLVRGAYHFLTPDVPAREQAKFFISCVCLAPGDLPPVLDIEDERKWLASGRSKADIMHMAMEWLDVVEQHYGVKPIIYSSYRFRRNILDAPCFDSYPFWMAHYYVSQPATDIAWSFWQHTDCGKLDGIKGPVDCNVFNGNDDDFDEMLIKDHSSKDTTQQDGIKIHLGTPNEYDEKRLRK